MADPIAMKQL